MGYGNIETAGIVAPAPSVTTYLSVVTPTGNAAPLPKLQRACTVVLEQLAAPVEPYN